MDLGLTEEQQMLREFARDFLEKECPEQHVRDMEEDERGYSPDLWRKMAEQGWPGLVVPDNYGGVGMTYLDLVILIEEFGRALVPGPFISNCVATLALMEAGTELQKQEYLPLLASGTAVLDPGLHRALGAFRCGRRAAAGDEGRRLLLPQRHQAVHPR